MHSATRHRLTYAAAAGAAVGLGLFWRSRFLPLPAFLVKYGGDAIWAALVYALVRYGSARWSIPRSAAVAFAISAAVEFGQIYHAPWIDAVRGTRLGALALGNTFNWPDIPAYAVGILLAALLDGLCRGRFDSGKTHPKRI